MPYIIMSSAIGGTGFSKSFTGALLWAAMHAECKMFLVIIVIMIMIVIIWVLQSAKSNQHIINQGVIHTLIFFNASANEYVLSLFLKMLTFGNTLMCFGRISHSFGADTENARSP